MNRQRLMAVPAILLLLVFAVAAVAYNRMEARKLAELARQPNSVFNRPHSPTYGPADAKVRIVEFFDPACETCRAFYPLVKNLVDSQQGRVQLVMR